MNSVHPSPRFDPILPVHKALRHALFDVLTQVGALDASDIFAVDGCAKQVGRLVELLPSTAATLRPAIEALYQRETAARRDAADCLYRVLTSVVTEQLIAQQQVEATRTAELQSCHDDEALRAMRRLQLGAMSEAELADALRFLGAALTPHELCAFVDDLQATVDAQTFGCLVDTLRRRLPASRWERIARELGLPDGGSMQTPRSGSGMPLPGACPSPPRRQHRADRHRLFTQ